jgi:hypothetical protein
MLHSEYMRIRHPPETGGLGDRSPDMVFDCLAYTDLLLNDIGMNSFRKRWFWKGIFSSYSPADFSGLVQERLGGIKDLGLMFCSGYTMMLGFPQK